MLRKPNRNPDIVMKPYMDPHITWNIWVHERIVGLTLSNKSNKCTLYGLKLFEQDKLSYAAHLRGYYDLTNKEMYYTNEMRDAIEKWLFEQIEATILNEQHYI